jgi:hypothetical protein
MTAVHLIHGRWIAWKGKRRPRLSFQNGRQMAKEDGRVANAEMILNATRLVVQGEAGEEETL